jgi:two-component system sensor histidine kinase/response regulator
MLFGQEGGAAGQGGDAPVDLSVLREVLGDDAGALRELLQLFVSTSEPLLVEIDGALGGHQATVVTKKAHELKGAAGNVGAGRLASLATELNQAGKDEEWDRIYVLVPRLQVEFQRVREFVEGF